MNSYVRTIIFLIVLSGSLALSPLTWAQVYHPDATFKDSLINLLYQYGKEVYYRGVDPQEASFVFQRILSLECDHSGAKEFLVKIRQKYPHISIRIQGCQEISQSTGLKAAKSRSKNDDEDNIVRDNNFLPGSNVPAMVEGDPRAVEKINSSSFDGFVQPVLKDSLQSRYVDSLDDEKIKLELTRSKAQKLKDGLSSDCDHLRILNKQLLAEIEYLRGQLQEKDAIIAEYQEQLAVYQESDSASYAAIAKDQKDLIRIQQGNIDYLQKELDEVKDQMRFNLTQSDPKVASMHQEIAGAQLMAKENEMQLEAKNKEAYLLQKQLGELQEQLQLVKKILSEKNEIINSLQEEIESLKLESAQ